MKEFYPDAEEKFPPNAPKPLLDEFDVAEVVRNSYQSFFPYYSSLEYEASPSGNANNRCYLTRDVIDGNMQYHTGWELYQQQTVFKEGIKCSQCHYFNPWAAPLNETIVCRCVYYRTDLHVRSSSNPYFHEDNRRQREHDYEDEARRQMQD